MEVLKRMHGCYILYFPVHEEKRGFNLVLLKFLAIHISIPVFNGWINVDVNLNDYFEVKQVVYVDDKIYDGLIVTQRIHLFDEAI